MAEPKDPEREEGAADDADAPQARADAAADDGDREDRSLADTQDEDPADEEEAHEGAARGGAAHGGGHDDHGHDHDHERDHGHDHGHGQGHGHGPEVKDETRLGPARKKVEVADGVQVAYVDEGEGPVLLLIHGFPTSATLWRGVVERLSGSFRCIAPDLLGFGDSVCPVESDYSLRAQARHIIALLDALEVSECAVVGHDWGGPIAQLLATERADRVSHLVLVDSPAYGFTPPAAVRRLMKLARLSFVFDLLCETGLVRTFASADMRKGASRPDALSDAFIADCIAPLFKETPPAYRAPRERFRRAFLQILDVAPSPWRETSEALKGFTKPTLVVWGCDDPFVSLSYGKQLAEDIPGSVGLELVPFAGHWVPEEAPDRLASLIEEYVTVEAVQAA